VPYSISSPLLYRQGFEYRRIDPKGGSIGLVAVIVLDTDSRPELHAARNQRIVEDQGHQFGRAHPQVQAKSRTDLAAAQAMQSAKRELFAGFVKPKRRA
jgi:hypothetical protein